jgi:2-C-methyl-D-erythritol 2,4-cyclodiphosphate synthase
MKKGYETTDGATYNLLLEKAREMRNNPTEAEALLWNYLVGNKMGCHFRRQHPVMGYIPDFICLEKKLIIEIDGGYHFEGEQPEKDAERTAALSEEGYTVLRFSNEEVTGGVDLVLETIDDYLITLPSVSTSHSRINNTSNTPVTADANPSLREGHRVGPAHSLGIRVGFGYDVHKLVEGRDLWLGGIKIPHTLGLLGHSDADVLIHAICDALLGAANMRDIGYHWPDTSDETDGMDSKIILRETMALIATKGYRFVNLDATVCAERPKINPHVPAIKACLAEIMDTDEDNISIKATTTERLGFTGREEGMSAFATVLIER